MSRVIRSALWASLLMAICTEIHGLPDPQENSGPSISLTNFKLIIPKECQKLGICEKIPNYPHELVNKLLRDIKKHNTFKLNRDELPPQRRERRVAEEGEDLCASEVKLLPPVAGQDAYDNWHLVLNSKTNENRQQTFNVETCIGNLNSPCRNDKIDYFQTSYKGTCVQSYSLRNMVVLSKNATVIEIPIKVPTCCSCQIVKT